MILFKDDIFYIQALREGFKKKRKKKVGNFPLGEGGPENFENFSHFFLFIFKHGLNHPEMKRNFFSKVGTPPTLFSTSGKFPNLFLSFSYFANFGDGSLILVAFTMSTTGQSSGEWSFTEIW